MVLKMIIGFGIYIAIIFIVAAYCHVAARREERTMSKKLWQPFSNGAERLDWYHCNCHRCKLYNPDSLEGSCKIEAELGQGVGFGDGISKELVEKIGGTEKSEHTGDVNWLCDCQHKEEGTFDES